MIARHNVVNRIMEAGIGDVDATPTTFCSELADKSYKIVKYSEDQYVGLSKVIIRFRERFVKSQSRRITDLSLGRRSSHDGQYVA